MNTDQKPTFESLHRKHLQNLQLQGKSPNTIQLYSKAVQRLHENFDQKSLDTLSREDLKTHFSKLLKTHSWSTIKVEKFGLKFFWKHTLNRPWEDLDVVRPPRFKTLPDVLTIDETYRLLKAVKQPRYRIFFLTVYSMGLRLGEGLNLRVSDIDTGNMQIHIRNAKGNKDRLVPLPELTHKAMQWFWKTHRNPSLIFPNQNGSAQTIRAAKTPMDRGGVQQAIKAALRDVGISKRICVHSLRHSFATHLVEMGVNLRLIQDLLGHASPQTTAIYARLTEPSFQDRSKAINALMNRFEKKQA